MSAAVEPLDGVGANNTANPNWGALEPISSAFRLSVMPMASIRLRFPPTRVRGRSAIS